MIYIEIEEDFMEYNRKIIHLTLDNSLSITQRNSFDYIYDLVEKTPSETVAYIHLTNFSHFNTCQLTFLLLLTYLLHRKTKVPVRYTDIPDNAANFLMTSGIFTLDSVVLPNKLTIKERFFPSNNIFPLKKWTNPTHVIYEDIRRHIGNNFNSLPPDKKGALLSIVYQLVENCLEHSYDKDSKLEYYVMIQHLENKILLLVMDFGMGFYKNLKNVYSDIDIPSPLIAIERVILEHLSSNISGGTGFATIQENLNSFCGHMLVCSGNAVVQYHYKEKINFSMETENCFPGSYIYIHLNVDKIIF